MSETAFRETKSRVSLCDETVEIEARLACRDDADALIERIQLAADFMWAEEALAVPNHAAIAAAVAKVNEDVPATHDLGRCAGALAEAPLTCAEVVARAKMGPLDPDVVERVVAEQLSDAEFRKMSPAQSEAVALKRLGLSAMQIAGALGAPTEQSVWARISKAKDRGVTVERERAA